jgi:hypothetical protein
VLTEAIKSRKLEARSSKSSTEHLTVEINSNSLNKNVQNERKMRLIFGGNKHGFFGFWVDFGVPVR